MDNPNQRCASFSFLFEVEIKFKKRCPIAPPMSSTSTKTRECVCLCVCFSSRCLPAPRHTKPTAIYKNRRKMATLSFGLVAGPRKSVWQTASQEKGKRKRSCSLFLCVCQGLRAIASNKSG